MSIIHNQWCLMFKLSVALTYLLASYPIRVKMNEKYMIWQLKRVRGIETNRTKIECNNLVLSVVSKEWSKCIHQQCWWRNAWALEQGMLICKMNKTFTSWNSFRFLSPIRRSKKWWAIICYSGYRPRNIFYKNTLNK